jgi:iron(III) transport system permease protein
VRFPASPWTLGTLGAATLAALPLLAVVGLAATPSADLWRHLVSTVLPGYVRTTFALMIGVAAGTVLLGTATAWIATMCRFPGRRVLEVALLLPLAVPAYVIAYVYTDLLEYAGPVQVALREVFGWTGRRDYWFPEIRSLGGAVAMMTLVLYPYVYLLARAAFLEQSVCVLEVSRTLGRGPWRSFFEVALPLARPAIVVGLILVSMETLNDYGTVDYFAVRTFTLGIFDVWLNQGSVGGAAQLALVMLAVVGALIAFERLARRGQKYHHTTTRYRALPGYALTGWRAAGAFLVCALPVVLGFLLPALVLGRYALLYLDEAMGAGFLRLALNSLGLGVLAAAIAVALGLFLAYGLRLHGTPLVKAASRVASVGYAVPGSVLAVGVMIPLASFDNALDGIMRSAFGVSTGLLLSGTIAAVTYGYVVRFLALSFGSAEAGLGKVTASMDGAARTLGAGPASVLGRVHLPMVRGSLLTAATLVFVDCMKELPLTVILRPFGFETLATHVHRFVSDERLAEGAPAALAIVLVGVLPVILLSLAIRRARPGHAGTETMS